MSRKKCEAFENGFCLGCDEFIQENIDNNFFPYYLKKFKCETLEKYRKKRSDLNE